MKPKLYHGNNPMQFAPCDAVLTQREESIKLHLAVTAIHNKRRRMRLVRIFARSGIRLFIRPAWEIYQT